MKKLLLIGLIILFFSGVALGNSGPPIIDPVDQSITFNDSSGISLIEEWVKLSFKEINYNDSNKLDLNTGHVSVKYKLKNLEKNKTELDILFISPELDSSSISIKKNGKEISGFEVNEELTAPKNWGAKTPKEIIEPISNKKLYETPNNIYSPNRSFTGISFKINFDPQEIITLDIGYESTSGYYNHGYVANQVYSQIYYLTPAKFWEGDSKVNLMVEFPKGSNTSLHSNIPLNKINSHSYEGQLDKIPHEEWVLTFVDTSKLIFGTNNRTIHNSMVLMISLAGIISGIILRKKSHRLYGIILWLISIAFLIYFVKPTYGSMFLIYIFGPWILLVFIAIYCVALYRKKKNAYFS